jgi:succinyl-CoA synthetase alpha subunit
VGRSFGHAAALLKRSEDSASAKKARLRQAGARVAETLEEIPRLLLQS